MAEPVLYVSWNDHANELSTVWKTLLENNSFVDCTIAAEGKSLKAHRLILSACSPYFHMLFSEEREKYPIVVLKDTLFYTLKMVIDFVYYGKAEIPENKLEAFLELAESLQIKGLNNSLQRNRKPDMGNIGSSAGGNARQCASSFNQGICEVESTWTSQDSSNSSQQLHYHISSDFTDSLQTDSVPFEKRSDSCEKVQSGTPVQDHQSPPEHYDPEVSKSTEISVKHEPFYSEIEVLNTESKVLDYQSSPVHNDPEVSMDTEISVKREPLYSEIEYLETKSEVRGDVEPDEPISGNFGSETNDVIAPAFEQNLDQFSDGRESFHVKENLALVLPLQQQPQHYHHQQQLPQQYQQHLQKQPSTHLSCELSSTPELANQHDSLLPELPVPVSEKKGDAGSEECIDAFNVPSNDVDEMDAETEPTFEQNLNPRSSAEYILPEDYQATQRPSGRERRPHESNSLPVPSEQQMPASGKAFTPAGSLPSQVRRRPEERRYPCELCGNVFTQSSDLAKHIRTHTGERAFACEMCGKAFTHASNLVIHKRMHTGERPYVCDVCGKAFIRSDALVSHKRLHTGERPHSCHVCGKAYRLSSTLARHKRVHTGERPFGCDVCGMAFTQSGNLSHHMLTHTGERPYPCDVCGKAFTRASALALHIRIHTGERPYSCDVCGKAFCDSRNLSTHMRIHTGERPYSCDMCGKTFNQSSALVLHIRTHTGERPYQCDVCGRAFIHSGDLARHKSRHT